MAVRLAVRHTRARRARAARTAGRGMLAKWIAVDRSRSQRIEAEEIHNRSEVWYKLSLVQMAFHWPPRVHL